ncbi:MAG: CoA transferase [Deltaproteobacteria bacterium]|nr:CoA transferase [Deltaproteobacteria bacterium]
MEDDTEITGMLKGLSILDLADAKGSFCSKLLADMGARVIKVEKPCDHATRSFSLPAEGQLSPRDGPLFFYLNNNKLGITLNLETPDGRLLFLRLLKENDVVIESFPVGYLGKNRLDFNSLKQVNPGLIMASITGFGQTGPRKDYSPCDIVLSAFGGHMSVSGSPSRGPIRLFGDQSYFASSLFMASSIIIALRNRRITGQGAHLDISIQESVTATLDHVMPSFFSDGIIAGRRGSFTWNNMFTILPCKDGFIQVSLFYQWETLVEWLDNEGMSADLTDKKWLDEDYRGKNISHVTEILSRWSKKHPVHELFTLGQSMHFPWAPVQSVRDLINCPQLKARSFFIPVHHSGSKKPVQYPGTPFTIKGMRTGPQSGVPKRGRDNFKIYHDELGISKEELEILSRNNII